MEISRKQVFQYFQDYSIKNSMPVLKMYYRFRNRLLDYPLPQCHKKNKQCKVVNTFEQGQLQTRSTSNQQRWDTFLKVMIINTFILYVCAYLHRSYRRRPGVCCPPRTHWCRPGPTNQPLALDPSVSTLS